MKKLIITAALTGSETRIEDTPYLPTTPEKIAEEALKARETGAAIVHIHARDPATGRATTDLKIFRKILSEVRRKCPDIIVNLSTGGTIGRSPEEQSKRDDRIAIIPEFRPELASLNLGSMNYFLRSDAWTWECLFVNTFADIEYFSGVFAKHGTKPECEIYDSGMINNARILVEKGALKAPLHMQFVMGISGGISATPENLIHLHQSATEFDRDCSWSVCAPGRFELPMANLAIILGGHARVGLEDNIYVRKGVLAKSNAELVSIVARMAYDLGREVATPDEARKMLDLKGLDSVNF